MFNKEDFFKYFNKSFWKGFKEIVIFYESINFSKKEKDKIISNLYSEIKNMTYYPSVPKAYLYKEKKLGIPRIIPVFEIKDYCLYYYCIKRLENKIEKIEDKNSDSKSEDDIMQELLKAQGGEKQENILEEENENKEEIQKTELGRAIEKEKISTNSLLTSSIGKSLEPGENIEKLGFFYNIYDTFSKRPRSSLALIGISLAIIFSWYWFFGVLSLYWAINDIKNKATYLLEPVEESEFPGLFWMIVLMYFVLGSYVLLNSFNMI